MLGERDKDLVKLLETGRWVGYKVLILVEVPKSEQHKVRTTKHNWSAWCQYNVTGWNTMWACDMLFQ